MAVGFRLRSSLEDAHAKGSLLRTKLVAGIRVQHQSGQSGSNTAFSHPQPKPGKAFSSSLNPFDHHIPGPCGWHLLMGWLFQNAVCYAGLVGKQLSWLWAEVILV